MTESNDAKATSPSDTTSLAANPVEIEFGKITESQSLQDVASPDSSEHGPPKNPCLDATLITNIPEKNDHLNSSLATNRPSQTISTALSIEQQLTKSKRDLESMVLKYAKSERENLLNKTKLEDLNKKLSRSIKDNEQLANRIKLLSNDKTHLTDTLNAKVAQLTVLEQKNIQLHSIQDGKLKDTQERLKILEETNEDLLRQIESYKSKEGELLDFSERLSMKHMLLQTEFDEALKKVPSYKEEYDVVIQNNRNLIDRIAELESRCESLEKSLDDEKNLKMELMAGREELEKTLRNTSDSLQNEIKVMRRKHQIAIKELTRHIKQLQSETGGISYHNGEVLEAS